MLFEVQSNTQVVTLESTVQFTPPLNEAGMIGVFALSPVYAGNEVLLSIYGNTDGNHLGFHMNYVKFDNSVLTFSRSEIGDLWQTETVVRPTDQVNADGILEAYSFEPKVGYSLEEISGDSLHLMDFYFTIQDVEAGVFPDVISLNATSMTDIRYLAIC